MTNPGIAMKTQLKKKLSRVKSFSTPNIELEQYMTPPELAADLIHTAYMQGDIGGKEVVDLGAGTGMLAIGAALASGNVVVVEKDSEALETARENAEKLGVIDSVDFRCQDVSSVEESFDTVVMNPPFSVHSDIGFSFLEKAFEVSEATYFLSRTSSRERIKDFVGNSRHSLAGIEPRQVDLPATYGFHTEAAKKIGIDLFVTGKENGT